MSQNNNNNNGPEDNDEVDGKSSKPRPRERSPSAMSQSSAGLEWDPSADVGTSVGSMPRAGSSGLHRQGTSSSQRNLNEVRGLQEVRSSSCNFIFGPSFDSSGRKPNVNSSRPTSRNSHHSNPVNAYSTPSASPVPLSLDYSPVAPEVSSIAERRRSQENLNHRSRNQRQISSPKASNVEDSSESNNNNDELTEGRHTPGRIVSEASTDWEYGSEKNGSSRSKYVSDWQTNGITRSEIEYRNRKKSGGSTSAASSIFLLQVEANMKNQSQGSANENPKRGDKLKESDSFPTSSTTDSSDLHRKMQISRKRAPNPVGESSSSNREGLGASSGSDPSSMCMIVKNFMKILDEDPGKQKVKYDVLKTHRDYHMAKVYKQISKLEKLNQALLAYKSRPRDRDRLARVESSHHPKSRSEIERALHHAKEKKEKASSSIIHHVRERRREPETSQSTPGEETRPLQSRNRKGDRALDRGYVSDPSTYVLDKISKLNLKPSKSGSKKHGKIESLKNSIPEDDDMSNRNMEVLKPVISNQQKIELPEKPVPEKIDSKPEKKPSVQFFLPFTGDVINDFVEEEIVEKTKFQVQGLKTIQECLREHKPQCYQNIKERDDFLIAVKRERQIHNETLLREALESDMDADEIDKFLRYKYRHVSIDDRRRLKAFWESYRDSQRIKENKENEAAEKPYIISCKEMRERTHRLRMNDHVVHNKQRKEADERRKRASRNLQKMFSTNLRQFQRLGSVNIPDRLNLALLPRPR